MAKAIHTIEAIGPRDAALLHDVGITTADQLLKAGAAARGRLALAGMLFLRQVDHAVPGSWWRCRRVAPRQIEVEARRTVVATS